MSANSNWSRWIFASISKHFNDAVEAYANANPGGVPPQLYVEGDERITANLEQYFEFRMDGPYFRERSRDFWQIIVQINILVAAKKTQNEFHTIYKLAGIIEAAFTNGITIYKYGDGEDDDQTVLECMTLFETGEQDSILTTYLGQLSPDATTTQASVEGYYRMHLSTSPEIGV